MDGQRFLTDRARRGVAVALRDLPKFLVLDPVSTARIEMRLDTPSCEIDVNLDNPRPGRSFVLLIGHRDGPFVQRVRLAGKARIHFAPETPGEYLMLLANPHKEPLVVRLRGRNLAPEVPRPKITRPRASTRAGRGRTPPAPRRTRARKPALARRPRTG